MHVERVLLETGDPGGEPFLLVLGSVGDHSLSLSLSLPLRKLSLTRNGNLSLSLSSTVSPNPNEMTKTVFGIGASLELGGASRRGFRVERILLC